MVDMGTWPRYVALVTNDATPTEIADRVADAGRGWTRTSVYRAMKKGSAPSPASVAAFAVAYGRNVLEAFVAAGHLELEDALKGLERESFDTLATLGFNVERPGVD